eukprot:12872558-Alexandrium_andersonii.AAC.1
MTPRRSCPMGPSPMPRCAAISPISAMPWRATASVQDRPCALMSRPPHLRRRLPQPPSTRAGLAVTARGVCPGPPW